MTNGEEFEACIVADMTNGKQKQVPLYRKFSRREVISRVKSWYDAKRFVPWHLREVLLGLLINFGTIELSAYKLLKQDVNAGDLPPYILDIVILVMGCLEVVVAPVVAWWGSRKRRTTITTWVAVASVCCLLWFTIPNANENGSSEYCGTDNQQNITVFKEVSTRTGIRLGILFLTCAMFMVCRVAIWSHGLAYIEEYAPDIMGFYFGVVLLARVVTLLIDEQILTSPMDSSLILQTGYILLGMVIYLVPLPFLIPKTAPVVDGVQKNSPPKEETGFLISFSRVCDNRLAISQMVAMGLLAASLWGFAYHEADIVKVKYNLISRGNESMMYSELLQYGFAMFIVAYYGDQLSAPILKQFSALKVVKQAVSMSFIALVLYAVLAVYPTCDRGEVAELRNDNFVLPQCSLKCGCENSYKEFSPVCVQEEMMTYLSPCHAGCSDSDILNSFKIYTNCTCSSAHVLPGACSREQCTFAFYLYRSIFITLATVVLLGLQAQGILVLRSVDDRDKSLVLGMASSVVAAAALVIGQLIYALIYGLTCRWYGDNRCHLHGDWFPPAVGAASAILALLSMLVCIPAFFYLRSEHKKKTDQNVAQSIEI